MNVIFFDDKWGDFLPLTYTKPVAALRFGILSMEERWVKSLEKAGQSIKVSYFTEDYLQTKFPRIVEEENVFINSRYLPNNDLVNFLLSDLKNNHAVKIGEDIVIAKGSIEAYESNDFECVEWDKENPIVVNSNPDFFSKNAEALRFDYDLITEGRNSQPISETNTIIGDEVFLEEGAKVEAVILNSTSGPIYIGKNAEIMEGSVVRGGLAVCDNGALKLATKIYGATTVGPHSKVGGEVNNSVIMGYSNKGHDGFLGNSVLGEWCNLGADTNNSNLKNNYAEVKLWDYESGRFKNTGLQFCGLIMGDHSKCGINTMFNTGTVVGVSANIFGAGFPRNFVASFTWGGASGVITYKLDKVFEVAEKVMQRRGIELSEDDKNILTTVFEKSSQYRK